MSFDVNNGAACEQAVERRHARHQPVGRQQRAGPRQRRHARLQGTIPPRRISSTLTVSDIDDANIESARRDHDRHRRHQRRPDATTTTAATSITQGTDNDTTDVLTLTGTGTRPRRGGVARGEVRVELRTTRPPRSESPSRPTTATPTRPPRRDRDHHAATTTAVINLTNAGTALRRGRRPGGDRHVRGDPGHRERPDLWRDDRRPSTRPGSRLQDELAYNDSTSVTASRSAPTTTPTAR